MEQRDNGVDLDDGLAQGRSLPRHPRGRFLIWRMTLLKPPSHTIGELLLRAFMVAAPRVGDACGLLAGDASPALGKRAVEAGISITTRRRFVAEQRHAPLTQNPVLGCH